MKGNFLSMVFILAAAFLITSCQKDPFTANLQDNVGLRVNCDPCEGDIIFGPQTFYRSMPHAMGKPVAIHRAFVMAEDVDVCLTVINNGVSSAWIEIDGVEIFTPSNFKKKVTTLQTTTFLYEGSHEVTVTMKGKPGGSITLILRGCITQPPPQILCSEAARMLCESADGYSVAAVYPSAGLLYCTYNGASYRNICDTCAVYDIFVWKDGAKEQVCLEDGLYDGPYSTVAGRIYSGHNPCVCGDNLLSCGTWDMGGCIPDD